MADLAMVEKKLAKVTKEAKSGDKELNKLKNILEKLNKVLATGQSANQAGLNREENLLAQNLGLLTTRPVLYLLNKCGVILFTLASVHCAARTVAIKI